MTNDVATFGGAREYEAWIKGAGADADIGFITERGGQIIVTYRRSAAVI